MRSKLDKLDADKLVPVPDGLSKLSDGLINDDVKKDVYNAEIRNIEDKIPHISNLATKSSLNAKIIKVKGEIPSITNSATKASLNAVENKIPTVSNLVTKIDYNTKFNDTEKKNADNSHDKYVTIPEFNRLSAENFIAKATLLIS